MIIFFIEYERTETLNGWKRRRNASAGGGREGGIQIQLLLMLRLRLIIDSNSWTSSQI
jgi:hypothetical protein